MRRCPEHNCLSNKHYIVYNDIENYCPQCGKELVSLPICEKCGKEIWEMDKYCRGCGVLIERCKKCNARFISSDTICGECGTVR